MSDFTICLDFDGVLHSYTSGWKGRANIPDPPVPGAQSFVRKIIKAGYRVAVQSARASGDEGHAGAVAILRWMREHDFPVASYWLFVARSKPPALLYVDDRGYRFEGDFGEVLEAIGGGMIPWNKKE